MRFVLYNIRYGTGSGWRFHLPFPFSGYLKRSSHNLERISSFLNSAEPDIVGLLEVDNGSYRSKKTNQAAQIATDLNFTHVYESKYSQSSLIQEMPLIREQGNAFLTNQNIEAEGFHYFQEGIKRLVIQLELKDLVIFLVHLSVKFRHRHYQLSDLYSMFEEVRKPMIVAGDFNPLWGDRELDLFLAATRLINANAVGQPTYPSRSPRRQLDFIFHSQAIRVTRFDIPEVQFSDHRPLICDFELVN